MWIAFCATQSYLRGVARAIARVFDLATRRYINFIEYDWNTTATRSARTAVVRLISLIPDQPDRPEFGELSELLSARLQLVVAFSANAHRASSMFKVVHEFRAMAQRCYEISQP